MRNLLRYRIDSEIEIEATPEQVWSVFGDFAAWGKWNDFMVLPVVPEEVGKSCRCVFFLDDGCMKQSVHEPEILVLDTNKELRWRDYRGPLVSQFFRGSHWWILQPLPNGHTRFVHGAEMMGLLLPLIQRSMHATRRGYTVFNKALREEVLRRLEEEEERKQQQRVMVKVAAKEVQQQQEAKKAGGAGAGRPPVVTIMAGR